MQLQADLLGRTVHVADSPDASALGVALLAARSLGLGDVPPAGPPRPADPRTAVGAALSGDERAARRAAWGEAVLRSRGLAVTTDRGAS